jgi:outer membrane protein
MSFRMFRPLLACSAFLLAGHAAMAQSKVAVISLQKALVETAEVKKANDDMQSTVVKPKQQRADQLNQELAAISQKLQDQSKLTEESALQLKTEGQRKQVELQRLQEDLEAEATRIRQEVLGKSSDRMQAVVKKLAEEKGLDLVVDTQVALFFKPAMDLTAEATAAYDKAYPVAASPAPPKK